MDFFAAAPLYVFVIVQLIAGLLSLTVLPFLGGCKLLFGRSCDGPETVLTNYNAIWLLDSAVFFFVLAWLNQNNAPKIKRLSFFAIYCTFINLTGVFFAGSTHQHGVLPRAMHIVGFAVFFLVLIILSTAVRSDSPVAGTQSLTGKVGLNTKGFVVLMCVLLLFWIIVNGDVQHFSDVVKMEEGEKLSQLGRTMWNGWSALALELFLLYWFVVFYGDEKEDEAACVVTIVMSGVVASVIVWLVREHESKGIVKLALIQDGVIGVLALAAVVRYRVQGGRGDYEPVSSNV
jgi:hypothetical protein